MRYRIDKDGKYIFHTFGEGQKFNADVWLDASVVDFENYTSTYYNDDGTVDTDEEEILEISDLRTTLIAVVESHLQEPVNTYNDENGTIFEDAYRCSVYLTIDTYPHQLFCIKVVAFIADVWDNARLLEKKILSGAMGTPTAEEFKALLPVFV